MEVIAHNKPVVIERVLGGIGDIVMTRPAINAFIAQNPDVDVYLRTSRPLDGLYADIPCAGILLDTPKTTLFDHYDLNAPCLNYELDNHPFAVVNQKKLTRRDKNITLSRQEVFCNKLGVKFDINNYNVRFTDEELGIAESYTKGLSNLLLVHCNSNEPSRTYKYEMALLRHISKHWDGHILAIRPKQVPKNNNIMVWSEGPLRQLWAVMYKAKAFIGVDSGPIHMAGALGIPVYGIFGPIDPAIRLKYKHAYWKPIKCKYTKDTPCWYTPCKGAYCMSRYPKEIYKDAMSKLDLSVSTVVNRIHNPITIKTMEKPNQENMKDVAICRVRGIGDVLLTLPAIKAYKDKYPHINIDYITDECMVDILKTTGLFRDVIGVKYNHIGSGYPDLPPGVNRDIYNHVYNLINKVDFEKESESVPRIELFARELGLKEAKLERVSIQIPKELHDGKVVVIQSDSNGESRKWQIQRQIELCSLLKDEFLITTTGLKRNESFPEYVNNLTGRQTPKQFFETIASADIVIAPDSSAVHIAGCLGVKCIGLYGSVNPELRTYHYPTVTTLVGRGRCVPCNDWQKSNCYGQKNYPMCLWNISARTVYNKIGEIL